MTVFYILVALGVGFYVGRRTKKNGFALNSTDGNESARQLSRDALSERTEGRKEEIIEMMENTRERHEELKACGLEKERKGINRRDVEELLDVSKNTALKYINELEEEGRIVQVGHSGSGVYYMLNL